MSLYRDPVCLAIGALCLGAAVAIPVVYWLLTRGAG